jgi:molybdopterin-guanine dinucleotide biosynthesis protein A
VATTGPGPKIDFGGAVLAGGSSVRMGRDKAFIDLGGSSLLERAVDALRAAGASPVVIVGGDANRIEGLGFESVADEYPGEGPLGGILTALGHLRTEVVVVMACDHVEPSSDAVRAVVGALGSAADVAVPISGGAEQWLHAAWRRGALGKVRRAFAEGSRAPREMARRLSVSWLVDGEPGRYRDADRPDDLPNDPH